MANFQTHIVSGVFFSGLASTVLIAGTVVTPAEAVALTLAGTIGSILPDIDLQHSRQSRYLFAGLGLLLGFIALFEFSSTLSIAELWAIWLGVYILFRYVVARIFDIYTVHRGVIHSLLSAVFFAITTVALTSSLLGQSSLMSWMSGFFLFMGFVLHLLLDELYSVDFGGQRVKRSFGTAIKLFDYKNPASALVLIVGCVLASSFSPPSDDFRAVVVSKDNWTYLKERFFPYDGWFGLQKSDVFDSTAELDYLDEQPGNALDDSPTATGSID